MTRFPIRSLALAGALALAPSLAFAHPGGAEVHGFTHGFAHPVTGLDHVLAMVAVGMLAFQMGGRAMWMLPLTFMALMIGGGVAGMMGLDLPYVELGIGLSVVVLGGAVAAGVKAPLAIAMALVGAFALFHGHAHGTEMPETVSGLAYGAGFLFGTGLLHLAGLGLGFAVGRAGETRGPLFVRGAGAALCAAGLAIVAGVI
ncbi:hypothetical protein GCM10007301_47330 [Azorhizobium oxalatiphilum]|uniref:Urease accessory protein n=1 Tax=Azorhizobium oxalatiphilum TaxID=980631 RepID=A0A917CAZ9_9HYPH|nr:HupE/UreJ family protein [Azorhizobium oxalatiphilum]GGF81738.1 hypothetical protein GCM10007301_47330 [Azorhizobium oxalatiphilum]